MTVTKVGGGASHRVVSPMPHSENGSDHCMLTAHGRRLACIDPDVRRSKVKATRLCTVGVGHQVNTNSHFLFFYNVNAAIMRALVDS